MISIQYKYATYKVKIQGGKIEEYVKEWNDKHAQSLEILKQKGLYDPTIQATQHKNGFTSLTEAGFIDNVRREAHFYGLDSVVGFYACMRNPNQKTRTWVANIFGILQKDMELLEHKVKEKIGQDYISLDHEMYGFPRETNRKGALNPKDLSQ